MVHFESRFSIGECDLTLNMAQEIPFQHHGGVVVGGVVVMMARLLWVGEVSSVQSPGHTVRHLVVDISCHLTHSS